MPHHTFRWEGIDGTRVFTHFPPVDTYNSELSGADLARAERNYPEHGEGTMSLVPFGFGDGGGGPTREMMAAARRTASLEGSPAVRIDTPAAFFAEAAAEYPDPPVWSGEMYLELHRATYTTQARTKQGNRRSEHLLREAELWAATAAVRTGCRLPVRRARALWQLVLLQQFHDILPGSSIAWVHRDAERNNAAIAQRAAVGDHRRAIGRAGRAGDAATMIVNAAPHAATAWRRSAAGAACRRDPDRQGRPGGGRHVLDNGCSGSWSTRVGITSLVDPPPAARPSPPARSATCCSSTATSPTSGTPGTSTSTTGASSPRSTRSTAVELDAQDDRGRPRRALVRRVDDRAGDHARGRRRRCRIDNDIDWHEQRKMLKLAFALDVHADRSAAETQFGHV